MHILIGLLIGLMVFFLILGTAAYLNRDPLEKLFKTTENKKTKDKILDIKDKNIFTYTVLIAVLTVIICYTLFGVLIALLSGTAVFLILPKIIHKYKKQKLQKSFNQNLIKAVQTINMHIQAGSTLLEGLRKVDVSYPASEAFKEMVEDIERGVSFKTAADKLARKVGTPEARFFTNSIVLLEELGGSEKTFNLLESVADNIREKEIAAEKIKAASGHLRYGFLVAAAIPFVISGFMSVNFPEHTQILMSNIGKIMILLSFAFLAAGWFIICKMVNEIKQQA